MENYQSQYIDKLNVGQVAFNNTDALACTDKKFRRRLDLQKALKLGNLYKQSVKITFISAENIVLKTEGTVWAITQNYVILKASSMIPIASVIDVEFA